MKLNHSKTTNSKLVEYSKTNVKINRPYTYGSTLMEVGGCGPIGDEGHRNTESDCRHMLAFLFDLAKSQET
jgi:hypothetical protein